MTVSSTTTKASYSGNGSTTVFAVPFYFLLNADLLVILRSSAGVETTQVLGTNYSVTGAGNEAGGSLTMTVAPPTGTTLTILRNAAATQETDLLPNDRLPAESLETALDKLTMLVQQLDDENNRTIKFAITDTNPSATLPSSTARANKVLAFDNNGNPIVEAYAGSFVGREEFQTATAGQTVFNLTTMSYNPGANNLQVFVDGVNQYAGTSYTETSSTRVTFTQGLHVGALVKFSTVQTQSSLASSSNDVQFLQSGVGAITRSVQSKLRDTVSVKDFGAVGNGVADDTAAIQAGINACVASGSILFMPAGTYLVTDTLNCPTKTMISGEHKSMSAINNGTRINFQPTSVKSLFSTGPTGSFKDGYCFENLFIVGNSASATGNSFRAFDLIKVIKSTFRNMRVDGFRTGFRVEASIGNRFEFIQLANHYVNCVSYTGDFATTDVWEQCYISNAPIGVQTDGANIGIRFTNCLFETLETYGINIVKDSYAFSFINCTCEDVPSTSVSTNAMFRVGYDGFTLSGTTQLIVVGGYYGGRNAGAAGSLFDIDFTDGVSVGDIVVARFTNVIKTTANTQTNQVVANGWTAIQVGNMVTDSSKVCGYWPIGTTVSGSRNLQTGKLFNVLTGPLTLDSGANATTAGKIQIGNVTGTAVGAAGGASALPATPLGYITAFVGSTEVRIPYYNA